MPPCGARPASPPFCGHEWPFQSTRPMRGATQILRCDMAGKVFQSTRPMRGATGNHAQIKQPKTDFNPRAPCGARPDGRRDAARPLPISIHAPHAGRDGTEDWLSKMGFISIHAPHAGRDISPRAINKISNSFQSTRPMRGATHNIAETPTLSKNFNPRAPCGARQAAADTLTARQLFQSTRPMRGATGATVARHALNVFQSTRPMRGAT